MDELTLIEELHAAAGTLTESYRVCMNAAERLTKLESAAQRFVDARRLLECSSLYRGSEGHREYVNAEQIAADELKKVLEVGDE